LSVIRKVWQDAASAIGCADKIVFIGYSFPPSDTIMKFFLGTSLANNRSGCRIIIIDMNADAVKKSLEQVFVNDINKYHIELVTADFRELIGPTGPYAGPGAFAQKLGS
jgi:hypothetical protein